MRLTLSILIVVIVILFLVSLMIFGCTQEINQIDRAKVFSVEVFNEQPNQDPGTYEKFLAQKILKQKGESIYKFKIKASGYIDAKRYLKKHPDHSLLISSSNSDGRCDVFVYTNTKTPDPEFFETD